MSEPAALAWSEMRDLDKNPYSPDEKRVVKYLVELMPDIGAGDDPIGFLLASHGVFVEQRKQLFEMVKTAETECRLSGLPIPNWVKMLLEILY